MATVKKSFSFSCPECDKTLRTTVRPAAGKKIKCPACGEPFVPEIEDEEEQTRVQKTTTLKVKTNASKAGAKRKPTDDEDDEDDEQPTPKKKKAGGSNMILIALLVILGGGMLGSVGLCAGAAFVWPGFLKSDTQVAEAKKEDPKNEESRKTDDARPGDGKNENNGETKKKEEEPKKKEEEVKKEPKLRKNDTLEAFIPANSTILVGLNAKSLRDNGQFDNILNKLRELPPGGPPPEVIELAREAERMLIAPVGEKQKSLVVIRFPSTTAIVKFKAKYKLTKEEMLADRYVIYRYEGKEIPDTVHFPGDRTAVLADVSDDELIPILRAAENAPVATSPAAAMAKPVETAHLWGAMVFDDNMRAAASGIATNFAKGFEQLKPASIPLERAKGATFSLTCTSSSSYTIRVNVECADNNDATTLASSADGFRGAFIKGFLETQGTTASVLLRSDLNTFKVRSSGAVATLDFGFSVQSTIEIAKLMSTVPMKEVAKNDPTKDKKGPPSKDPPSKTPPPSVAFTTTSNALIQEFRANSQAAKDKYKDKYIEISGKLVVPFNSGMVLLDGGEKDPGKGIKNVIADGFEKANADDLTKAQPGQMVTLRGYYRGDEKLGGIALGTCQLVSVQPLVKGPAPKFQPGQLVTQAVFSGIQPNGTQEKTFKLEKGQTVVLLSKSGILPHKTPAGKGGFKIDPRPTNVKIEIHRGQGGGQTLAQTVDNGMAVGQLEFTAPESDTYRIRVHNPGPGTVFQMGINVLNK